MICKGSLSPDQEARGNPAKRGSQKDESNGPSQAHRSKTSTATGAKARCSKGHFSQARTGFHRLREHLTIMTKARGSLAVRVLPLDPKHPLALFMQAV